MKKSTLSNKILNGVASLTERVANAAPHDWCWAWTYKPPMPSSMQKELIEKKASEVK